MELQTEPDESLLKRFAAGETAALGELARRYEPLLLGLCRGLLRGRSEPAMDVMQETWVRVIRFAATFDGRSSFKTWLYRIAVNQCRTEAARRHYARANGRLSLAPPADDPEVDEAASHLRQALQTLPPPQQEILLLCYHAGMTHETVAEVLEVPLGTVKSRLHAALKSLRQALGQEVAS